MKNGEKLQKIFLKILELKLLSFVTAKNVRGISQSISKITRIKLKNSTPISII